MAFTVEDGTGLPDSNSYASDQEFKDYWTERGFNFSVYSDVQIEVSLVKATDYIDTVFRNRFYGCPLVADQALAWPRYGVYVHGVPQEGVPVNVKRATYEYAKRAVVTPTEELLPDPQDTDATGQIVGTTRIKVGPIERETLYSGSGAETIVRYPAADKWLEDLMCSGSGVIRN